MKTATTNDGVTLCYEETGAGVPIVFVHEFGGDMRSWSHRYSASRAVTAP